MTTRKLKFYKEFLLSLFVSCSVSGLRRLVFRHLPVLRWLPQYKVKENLLCDVISGVGAGTIQVPQGRLKPASLQRSCMQQR